MQPFSREGNNSQRSRRDFLRTTVSAAGAALAAGGPVACRAGEADGPNAKLKASVRGCPREMRAALSGPWPSIRIPFTRHGEIDFAALRGHLDFFMAAKARAVVLTWGDSLFSLLTEDEIARVTKEVVQHVRKRALVVAADGSWWTKKTLEFANYCARLGADLLMVKPPDWAGSTTLDTLVAHYRAVSQEIPVMLVTNYLGSRGMAFGLDLCKRLREEVPGVVAVKDDVGGEFACKMCLLTHDRWALGAGGQKQNHMLLLPYGVDGYLSTFVTFKPEIAWRYWAAVERSDLRAARAVIRDYDMPLFDYLIASPGSFDAAIHGIYELFGLAKRYRRPPYHSLTDKQMEELAEFLRKRKILS